MNIIMIKKLLNSGIFWTFVTALISIAITIIFYEFSNKSKEPVYSITKEPTLIFDKDNASSNFKLISNDSTIIEKNVYVTSIVFWNNGELEIKKEDLRKEIRIKISDKSEILDYKITKQTEPEISNFKLNKIDNELIVKWDFFDPKFGFEFQVIYSGTEETQIEMDGYIIGTGIKKVTLQKDWGFFKYIAIILFLFQLYFTILVFKDFNKEKWKYYLFQSTLLIVGFYCSMTLMKTCFFAGYLPPF